VASTRWITEDPRNCHGPLPTQDQTVPLRVTTVHNVCGLACILGANKCQKSSLPNYQGNREHLNLRHSTGSFGDPFAWPRTQWSVPCPTWVSTSSLKIDEIDMSISSIQASKSQKRDFEISPGQKVCYSNGNVKLENFWKVLWVTKWGYAFETNTKRCTLYSCSRRATIECNFLFKVSTNQYQKIWPINKMFRDLNLIFNFSC